MKAYITEYKSLFRDGIITLKGCEKKHFGRNIIHKKTGKLYRIKGKDWHDNLQSAELRASHMLANRKHILETKLKSLRKDKMEIDGRSCRKPLIKMWK